MSAPNDCTFLELFAGAGGLSRGLEAAGWSCVAHAEVEPHARAVLRATWPDVPLLGDVRALSGGRKVAAWIRARFGSVALVSGGSPCQDLSVAGKRAGLVAGARSSLFFRQVRLWRVLDAPYFLWENVVGALSSNEGRDFALVLGAIVGAAVPVPADGWGSAGVAAGPTGVAAYRVLDLQHFGPPQRRRRVFVLGARAGGCDPSAVLLEPEGVCRHPAPRREARERVADSPTVGANQTCGFPGDVVAAVRDDAAVLAFDGMNQAAQCGAHHALRTGKDSGDCVLAFHHTQDPISAGDTPALGCTADGMGVLAFNTKQDGGDAADDVAPTLLAMPHDASHANGGGQVGVLAPLVVYPIQSDVASRSGENLTPTADAEGRVRIRPPGLGIGGEFDPMFTLAASGPAHAVVTVSGEGVTHALTHEGHDASEDGTGRGTPIILSSGQANAEVSEGGITPSLTCLHEAPIIASAWDGEGNPTGEVMGALNAHNSSHRQPGIAAGIPRRLMPLECERLMGWPDNATEHGIGEDGRRYRLSDSARYKLCGNGVGSPCAAWIGARLADAIGELATEDAA